MPKRAAGLTAKGVEAAKDAGAYADGGGLYLAVGAKGAQMVDVRWISVRPDWLALLQGRVQVGVLTLYRPTIILEADGDGVPNWEFAPGAGAKQKPGEAAAGSSSLASSAFVSAWASASA